MNPLAAIVLLAASPLTADLQAETASTIRSEMHLAMHDIRKDIRIYMLTRHRSAYSFLSIPKSDRRVAGAWTETSRGR